MGVGMSKLLNSGVKGLTPMTQIEKTAIQQADKKLEQERKDKLQEEIYDYLKGELEAIDNLDRQISKLKTEKVAHEENIKNIKQGNLEAIEKRRQTFNYTYMPLAVTTSSGWSGTTYTTGTQFYTNNVAGITVTTSSGKTTIF